MAKRVKILTPANIKGARPHKFPGFIAPSLATLHKEPPKDGGWQYEIKFDGWRVQAHVCRDQTKLFTRHGLDWTQKFSPIARALSAIQADVVLDGEMVASDNSNGTPSFGAVLSGKNALAYYVFDILQWNGYDLRGSPQSERSRAAAQIVERLDPDVRLSELFEETGAKLFKHACSLNLEGIVAKRKDATYVSGRSENWIKVKCVQRAEFEIVGFVPAPGSISALYLGERKGAELIYAGKVGTGFSNSVGADIRDKLEHIAIKGSPLTKRVSKPKARWVYPRYKARVEFLERDEGGLRHSSFKGLVKA